MAFSIKNPEADCLARRLARKTGESLTDVVTMALRERLQRVSPRSEKTARARIDRIVRKVAEIPTRDRRPLEEVLYDERGLPI